MSCPADSVLRISGSITARPSRFPIHPCTHFKPAGRASRPSGFFLFHEIFLLRTRRRSSSARRALDLSGTTHGDGDGLLSGINGTGTGEGIGRRDLRSDGHAAIPRKTDADTLVDAAGGDRTLGRPGKLHGLRGDDGCGGIRGEAHDRDRGRGDTEARAGSLIGI